MNEQVRFLTSQAQGDDVSRLQGGLLELGWNISSDELTAALYGTTTRIAVAEFQQQRDLPVTGSVDDVADRLMRQELAAKPRRRRVLGVVRHPNGCPGSGLTVHAFDKDLRHEQPLGKVETNGQGFYEIIYSGEQFARAEKGAADLVLRVYRGGKSLYNPSPNAILFNAPDLVVVNIDLAEGDTQAPSEFERLHSAVIPLLDGVALDSLREDDPSRDITFLAGETGFPGFKLAHFAVAQKLASAHKIAPEFFYALFAENTLLKAGHDGAVGVRFEINLGTELLPLFYDVVLLPAETVKTAIQQAVQDQFVSGDLTRNLDVILDLLNPRVGEARRYVAEEKPKTLFRHVERFLSAGKHEEVRRILEVDSLGDLPGLFARLQEAAAFTGRDQAVQAATEASLSELLGNDDRILESVRELHGIRQPEDLVRLARLDHAEWSEAVRTAAKPSSRRASQGLQGRSDTGAGSLIRGGHPMPEELIDLHASALVRKMEKWDWD